MNDLRIAFRMLVKSPGFMLAAVVTLGLGIGANTAIFSVFKAVVLEPFPYPEAHRLVHVWRTSVGQRWQSPCHARQSRSGPAQRVMGREMERRTFNHCE